MHVDPFSPEPITVTAAFPLRPRTGQYFKRPLELLKIHFTLVYLLRGQTVLNGLGGKKGPNPNNLLGLYLKPCPHSFSVFIGR